MIEKSMNNNILSHLSLELEAEGLSYKKASDFQGVLFTKINPDYADYLHKEQLHPYSQYLTFDKNVPVWHVNTLNQEAYTNIIEPLLKTEFDSFKINNGNIDVKVKSKNITTKKYSQLMEDFYEKKATSNIDIEILSLTSFKQRGRYNVTPDLRLIYQSLMMKYSAISGNESMIDEETLEQLIQNSVVSKYQLRTGVFPVEGRVIPGFIGKLGIKFYGTETMMRYIRMLLEFGEYSGIGIKTGMGMGAIRLVKEDVCER